MMVALRDGMGDGEGREGGLTEMLSGRTQGQKRKKGEI